MRTETWKSRRRLLGAGAAAAVGLGLSRFGWAAALAPTPGQTAGPFYPKVKPRDMDNDLVQVAGQPRHAQGQIAHIMGRVLDLNGRPARGVEVEIWQCDALGRYHHPREPRAGADPYFQGYGRMLVGKDGAYRFRTLKPVPYPGRTPHIHFRLSGPGMEAFTTQMYLRGEPRNEEDFLFARLPDAAARERLLVGLEPAPHVEPAALAGTFDIVLGITPRDG